MKTKQFKKLFKKIHEGNKRALEPIYEEYYEKMVVTAKFILKEEKDAQDAASEVILKILKMATKKSECNIENIGAYMNSAVRNAAIDIYKKKTQHVPIDFLDEVLSDQDFFAVSIDSLYLDSALKKLSKIDREIAVLYYFYDYKISEISKRLNMPIGTTKWKLSEVRKILYKLLK